VLLWLVVGGAREDFADLGTTVPKESYHRLRPSPVRPNDLWTRPDNGAARHKPLVVNRVLAIEKIGDWKKLEILVQNQSF